jgi:predicted house-cleaning noncanonical NTP pyrophosphatase (MazG superfamily)
VDHDEYKREITRKIVEEASGVSSHSTRSGLLKELADLLITIDAVKKEYGLQEEEITEAVEASIDEKGGYEDRLYLSWSSDTEYSSKDQGRGGFDD